MPEQLLKVGEDSNISSTHYVSNGNGGGTQGVDSDVIETDKDTEKEDILESGSLYAYDVTERDLDIREELMSVYHLMKKKEKRELIIPKFQRNNVWSPEQKSQFVESIILSFPIPPLYFNKTIDSKYVVVDGLQRITTLNEFLDNDFALKGLKALPKFNDKHFSELPEKIRVRIEDRKLNIFSIASSVPLEVVYDIFNRINTGGTQLNRQEIRNCIFMGKSTRLLSKLAAKDYFKTAINHGISPKRMKDQEAVLRYLAFKINGYENYTGDMSAFLEQTMKQINSMTNEDINALEVDFERVMKQVSHFFKVDNFRLPRKRARINIAVMESVSYFFSNNNDNFLNKNKLKIIENYYSLFNDNEYINAIKTSTGNKQRVYTRFNKATQILGKIN